jgi:hypothetical protein
MRTGLLSWCVIAILTSLRVSAQEPLPELLVAVDQKINSKFAAPSNFDLREATYFAKRYRIVQINFDLLEKPRAKFTITAFPNARVTVQATNIATPASFGASREWEGTVIEPRIHPQAMTGDVDPEQIEVLANKVSLWVSNEPIDVAPELRKELESAPSKQALISNGPSRSSTADNTAVMKIRTPTLSGKWLLPALQTSIRVMPVPEDPRYHVIYEEDRSKVPQGKEFEARRREYGQFRRALEEERKQLKESPQP